MLKRRHESRQMGQKFAFELIAHGWRALELITACLKRVNEQVAGSHIRSHNRMREICIEQEASAKAQQLLHLGSGQWICDFIHVTRPTPIGNFR